MVEKIVKLVTIILARHSHIGANMGHPSQLPNNAGKVINITMGLELKRRGLVPTEAVSSHLGRAIATASDLLWACGVPACPTSVDTRFGDASSDPRFKGVVTNLKQQLAVLNKDNSPQQQLGVEQLIFKNPDDSRWREMLLTKSGECINGIADILLRASDKARVLVTGHEPILTVTAERIWRQAFLKVGLNPDRLERVMIADRPLSHTEFIVLTFEVGNNLHQNEPTLALRRKPIAIRQPRFLKGAYTHFKDK